MYRRGCFLNKKSYRTSKTSYSPLITSCTLHHNASHQHTEDKRFCYNITHHIKKKLNLSLLTSWCLNLHVVHFHTTVQNDRHCKAPLKTKHQSKQLVYFTPVFWNHMTVLWRKTQKWLIHLCYSFLSICCSDITKPINDFKIGTAISVVFEFCSPL